MARESTPVRDLESIRLRAPGEELSRHHRPGAIRGAEPAALQTDGLENQLRDLVLRRFHQHGQYLAQRRRDVYEERIQLERHRRDAVGHSTIEYDSLSHQRV